MDNFLFLIIYIYFSNLTYNPSAVRQFVVAMSSSQRVNRGRACIVANRDYSEYYMCVHVVCQVTFLCSFQGIINN